MATPYNVVSLKRSVNRSPNRTIILAVIGGFIVLNIIILAVWCIVKPRRSSARRNHEIALDSHDTKTGLTTSDYSSRTSSDTPHQDTAYPQITMSLENSDTPRAKVPSSPRLASLRKLPKAYEGRRKEGKIAGLSPRNGTLKMHHLESMYHGTSSRRSNSMDSASIYSSASAPNDAHERMFQPIVLDPGPSSAPALTSCPNDLQLQQSAAIISHRPSTTIREELAPETYAKPRVYWKPPVQRKAQIRWKAEPVRNRLRTVSESSLVSQVPKDILVSVTHHQPVTLRTRPEPLPSRVRVTTSQRSDSSAHIAFPVVPPGVWPLIAPASAIRLDTTSVGSAGGRSRIL